MAGEDTASWKRLSDSCSDLWIVEINDGAAIACSYTHTAWQYWNKHPRVMSGWWMRRFWHTLFLLGFQFYSVSEKELRCTNLNIGATRNAHITAWSTFNICCDVGQFCLWFAGLCVALLIVLRVRTYSSQLTQRACAPRTGAGEWLKAGFLVVSPQVKVNTQRVLTHWFRKLVSEMYVFEGHTRNNGAVGWMPVAWACNVMDRYTVRINEVLVSMIWLCLCMRPVSQYSF